MEFEPLPLYRGTCQIAVLKPEINWVGRHTQSLRSCGWKTGVLSTEDLAWQSLEEHFQKEHSGVQDIRGIVDPVRTPGA